MEAGKILVHRRAIDCQREHSEFECIWFILLKQIGTKVISLSRLSKNSYGKAIFDDTIKILTSHES